MNHYSLLIKKQFIDAFPTRGKRGLKNSGLIATLLTLALVACIIAAFVFIFAKFTQTYVAIKINRVADIAARQYEIMSIVYFAVFVICLVSGINRLCYSLFENSDLNVLITMPFSALQIFISKFVGVYLRQLVLATVIIVPVNFTFFITTSTLTAYGGIMTFIVGALLPIVPLGIASALVLPYFYLKRAISSRYLLNFLVITLLMAAFCVFYAYLFKFAENLLSAGKIISLFNERVMLKIAAFAKYDYPANLFADIVLGRELGKSFGILIAFIAASLLIGGFIVHKAFLSVSQRGLTQRTPHLKWSKPRFIKRPRFLSLLGKELTTVLRTPGYTYMYFTTAIIMPLMAYESAKVSLSLLNNLLGDAGLNFEVCVFITLLYSTLTNTFCSTGISRDGYMAMTQKTLPYSPAEILASKVAFGAIVSEISIIAACITFSLSGLESSGEAAITFLSATMLSIAQIILATRMDLNHPHFSKTDDGEIKEANSTVSAIIVIGLAVCFTIGFLLMFNTVRGFISKQYAATDKTLSVVYALCIPLVLLGASLAVFFVNLKKKYANLDAEG